MTICISHGADWLVVLCFVIILCALAIELHKNVFPTHIEGPDPMPHIEKEMYERGYVFIGMWTIQQLEMYAAEQRYFFTHAEMGQIIKLVKDDFKEERGINKQEIILWMRYYVRENQQRDFTIPIPPKPQYHFTQDPFPQIEP